MDEIRVYWDEELRMYSICIGGLVITQSMIRDDIMPFQYLCNITEGSLVGDELVYDSTEDNDEYLFALIDEQLVIPDVIVSRRTNGELCGIRIDGNVALGDIEPFWDAVKESEEYHEGKEWSA